MRRFWIFLMLLVMLIACNPLSLLPGLEPLPTQEPTSTPILTSAAHLSDGIMLIGTQEVVNKMRALCCEDGWWDYLFDAENNAEETNVGAGFLQRLEVAGKKFDANDYFTVLTHLALKEGYVLDYVYFAPGGDGAPYLYARPEGEPPFATYTDYQEAGAEDYLSHIQVDETSDGYYELAVLSIMGGQFYLSWHFEYNDWEVVGSRESLEAIIERLDEQDNPLTQEQIEAALQLDVTPRVQFEGNKVWVRILVFTKWGGFYERVYTIDRDFPHQIVNEEIQLIPYDCEIVF